MQIIKREGKTGPRKIKITHISEEKVYRSPLLTSPSALPLYVYLLYYYEFNKLL